MKLTLTLAFLLMVVGCTSKSSDSGNSNESEKTAEVKNAEASEGNPNWAVDGWNKAVSSGGQTVENTTEWVSGLYQASKREGLTGAQTMKEWVTTDLKSQGDWQYKIVAFDPSDPVEIENQLNELGQNRWDCYHVKTDDDQWTFFMKRSKKSYLKNIPLRDLANILPALSGDEQ